LPDGLYERIKKESPFIIIQNTEVEECIHEFKKSIAVLILARTPGESVAMTREIIDKVWDTFVLFA
jgi:hypothetical protein